MACEATSSVRLRPRSSWTQTTLGMAIKEFRAKGWECDGIPRIISDHDMGFDVHLPNKMRVLVMANSRAREVNLCLRSDKDILKIRSVKGGVTAEKIVALAVEMLREASV